MNLISAFIKNLVVSNLWSILLAIIATALCADLIDNETMFILFICWLINAVISFFIHAFLFIPSVSLYKKWHLHHSIFNAYQSIYPVLLIPLAPYTFLMCLILIKSSPEPDAIGILAFIGTFLLVMHSLSLYTFIYQIFKNETHENNNQ